jgi:transcriptional regulator with GAF, ATPase, and Fis domain
MISRVGAEKDIKVDVRVIAATIKDLKTEMHQQNG